jgi:biotin carboxyl carrier protein
MKKYFWAIISMTILANACQSKSSADDDDADVASVVASVSVAAGENASIADSLSLNAISAYLLSTDVKANMTGYIENVRLHLGDKISKGETLFVLQTKEAKSLGNTINQLDSSFKFSGIGVVKSPTDGFITMLNHQNGDYVQDGETLATITNKNSFGFMLNLPFEYRRLLSLNQSIAVVLPDGTSVSGQVYRIMPQMDSVSQTQQVFVKTNNGNLPAGLIAKVVLVKQMSNGFTLPKECVLADDSQQNFWVMKLLNDSTAVKVPIQKGLENSVSVAVLSPKFSSSDRFVSQGGYGLSDTARISIQK